MDDIEKLVNELGKFHDDLSAEVKKRLTKLNDQQKKLLKAQQLLSEAFSKLLEVSRLLRET